MTEDEFVALALHRPMLPISSKEEQDEYLRTVYRLAAPEVEKFNAKHAEDIALIVADPDGTHLLADSLLEPFRKVSDRVIEKLPAKYQEDPWEYSLHGMTVSVVKTTSWGWGRG